MNKNKYSNKILNAGVTVQTQTPNTNTNLNVNLFYCMCYIQKELFWCDISLLSYRIFTDKHTLRSTEGHIFQGRHNCLWVRRERDGPQLVVLHLSPVRTADSRFWRISLHPSKKASMRLSGPISQLAFKLGLQWDLK